MSSQYYNNNNGFNKPLPLKEYDNNNNTRVKEKKHMSKEDVGQKCLCLSKKEV